MKRFIIALDFNKRENAENLLKYLDPRYFSVKIGSEMFTLFGPEWVRRLINLGYQVFLDLKFHDIPTTVAQACTAACQLGVSMVNVHTAGGTAMMTAARAAVDKFTEKPLLIGVTVLTSMTSLNMHEYGVQSTLEAHVGRLALLAKNSGLDGVVCSAHEVRGLKQNFGREFLTVTPGIRLDNDAHNDQLRIMTPKLALKAGSDFLVIGRALTQSSNPQIIVQQLLQELH